MSDAETNYHQLGRLIAEIPQFPQSGPLPTNAHLWLGRADALIAQAGSIEDKTDLKMVKIILTSGDRFNGLEALKRVLFAVFARAPNLPHRQAQEARSSQ